MHILLRLNRKEQTATLLVPMTEELVSGELLVNIVQTRYLNLSFLTAGGFFFSYLKGDQTEADDDEALSPKALTFSEGGKVSADEAEAEELKGALIDTFSKDERFHSLCQQLQQATSLSTDTLGGILADMLRVFGSSEYSSEFMFDLMALLPSVAGLLGGDFKNFLLDTLSKYENFMKNMNKDDSPDGLRMKNLLLSSYMKLIQSFDTDNVLTSMIAELEVEKKDHGVRNVRNGILHLSSMLTPQRK